MGGNTSKTTQVINSLNETCVSILNENVTSCTQDSRITQSIDIISGDNSVISLTDTNMTARTESKLACIATSEFSQTQLAAMSTNFNNAVRKESEGIPEIQVSSAKKNEMVTSITNRVVSESMFKNIITTIQRSLAAQSIVVRAGNGSTIVVDGTAMSAASSIISTATNSAISKIVNESVAESMATNTSTEIDKPITAIGDAATNILDSVGNTIGGAVDTAGSVAKYGIVMWIILLIVIVIVVGINFDKIASFLGMAVKASPAAKVASGVKTGVSDTVSNIGKGASAIGTASLDAVSSIK